jgi:hypothetical protein
MRSLGRLCVDDNGAGAMDRNVRERTPVIAVAQVNDISRNLNAGADLTQIRLLIAEGDCVEHPQLNFFVFLVTDDLLMSSPIARTHARSLQGGTHVNTGYQE